MSALDTVLFPEEVVLFGSLAFPNSFIRWSDIDLAVRGIPPERFLEAAGVILDLSPEFKIDPVDMDDCPPSLKAVIAQEGSPL